MLSGAHVPPPRRTWWRGFALPALLAFALRLALIPLAPAAPAWDGVIYARAARQLAHGEGYTLRILDEGYHALPTAFYPVGFPALLAGLRLAGGGLLADRVLQVIVSSLLVPISYLLARRAWSARAGRAAAWAAALWPGGIFLSATWLTEPVFALGLGLALLPLAYARRRQRAYALVWAALGLGAIAYVRASALVIAALIGLTLGYVWLRRQPLPKRSLGALALALGLTALACLPLAPWVARNVHALGTPVLVSTNGGVNLLLGARGDGGFGTIAEDEPCKRTPLGEIARDRCYSREALRLIATDPGSWLARGLLKLAHTYGHDSAAAQCFAEGLRLPATAQERWQLWALGLSRVGWLLLFPAALAGASLVAQRSPHSLRALLFAPVIAIAALHAIYIGGDRYHAAVAPMLMALAGVAFARRGTRDALALRPSDTLAPDRLDRDAPTQA